MRKSSLAHAGVRCALGTLRRALERGSLALEPHVLHAFALRLSTDRERATVFECDE